MKGLVSSNTHMQYESSITSGLKDMAKVKAFVHATDADVDTDSRAMTLAPRTYLPRLAKKTPILCHLCLAEWLKGITLSSITLYIFWCHMHSAEHWFMEQSKFYWMAVHQLPSKNTHQEHSFHIYCGNSSLPVYTILKKLWNNTHALVKCLSVSSNA